MQTKKVSPMCTKHDEASCTLNSSPEKLYKLSDSVCFFFLINKSLQRNCHLCEGYVCRVKTIRELT